MANLKNNTATMQSILQTVQNLPESTGGGNISDLQSMFVYYYNYDGGMVLEHIEIWFPNDNKRKDTIGLYFFNNAGLYPQNDKNTVCGGFVDIDRAMAYLYVVQTNNSVIPQIISRNLVEISDQKITITTPDYYNLYGYNPSGWYGHYIYSK